MNVIPDQERPNILFMISHDTGRYLGCYGRDVATPALDELATSGICFDNAFCSAPQCSPSRASINTGMHPHQNGMMGLAQRGWSISKEVAKLPELLSEAGYETALIGLQHEGITSDNNHGYQTIIDVPGERANDVADKAIQFLQEKKRSKNKQPFYASIGFFETHLTFD